MSIQERQVTQIIHDSQASVEVPVRSALDKLTAYAPGLRAEQVSEKCPGIHICKLSSNEYPEGPFNQVKKAIIDSLDGLHEYPDGSAHELKLALCNFYQPFCKNKLSEHNIFIGAGSNELLNLLSEAFLNAEDEVCYPWPSFVVYPSAADVMDAQKNAVSLDKNYRIDLAALLNKITPSTKIVYICNPNNPTSTVVTKEELTAFMDAVPPHTLVVFDEAYIEFADKGATVSGLEFFSDDSNVIVLRTFSKAYGLAGLRVGYGIAPKYVVDAIDKVRAPFNVSTVAQVAARVALECQDELAQRIESNAYERGRLIEFLRGRGLECASSQTNFVFFSLTDSAQAEEVFEGLLRHGIIVRPQGRTAYLRITVGSHEETTQCIDALDKLL